MRNKANGIIIKSATGLHKLIDATGLVVARHKSEYALHKRALAGRIKLATNSSVIGQAIVKLHENKQKA